MSYPPGQRPPLSDAQAACRDRWNRIEHARIERERLEREAAARGEPTRAELASAAGRRGNAMLGERTTKRNREKARHHGRFIDESPGADYLRRALGGDCTTWD